MILPYPHPHPHRSRNALPSGSPSSPVHAPALPGAGALEDLCPPGPGCPDRERTAELRAELAERGYADASWALLSLLRALWRWLRGDGRPRRASHVPGLRLVPEWSDALAGLRLALASAPQRPSARAEAARDAHDLARALEAAGVPGLARGFAELAAAMEPGQTARALEVARMADAAGDGAGAWAWLLHAARLARAAGEQALLCHVLVQMGRTASAQDHHEHARRLITLACRHALRRGLCDAQGDALLALGVMRHGLGHTDEALDHFRAAVVAYRPGNPRLPAATRAIADAWLAEGRLQAAGALYRLLTAHAADPAQWLAAVARLARTAAALGWEVTFERASDAALSGLWRAGDAAAEAAVLLDVARGAAQFGYWVRVEIAAERALERARAARDAQAAGEAARMLAVAAQPVVTPALVRDVFPEEGMHEADAEVEEPAAGDGAWRPCDATRPLLDAITCALRACPRSPLADLR